jgi:hypothetical protein
MPILFWQVYFISGMLAACHWAQRSKFEEKSISWGQPTITRLWQCSDPGDHFSLSVVLVNSRVRTVAYHKAVLDAVQT